MRLEQIGTTSTRRSGGQSRRPGRSRRTGPGRRRRRRAAGRATSSTSTSNGCAAHELVLVVAVAALEPHVGQDDPVAHPSASCGRGVVARSRGRRRRSSAPRGRSAGHRGPGRCPRRPRSRARSSRASPRAARRPAGRGRSRGSTCDCVPSRIGPAERPRASELAQEHEVVFGGLAEPEPGIDDQVVSGDAEPERPIDRRRAGRRRSRPSASA